MFVKVETEEQVKTVAELAREIWSEHYIPIVGEALVEYMLDHYQSPVAIADQIANQNYLYFLLHDGERHIGYTALQLRQDELFLSKVYVKSSQRGRGFGRSIIEFAKEFALKNGCDKISLTVNKQNSKSITVYEKCGFKMVKEVVIDISNGFVMDDYVMELFL